jgi:hypothetical protein
LRLLRLLLLQLGCRCSTGSLQLQLLLLLLAAISSHNELPELWRCCTIVHKP